MRSLTYLPYFQPLTNKPILAFFESEYSIEDHPIICEKNINQKALI